MKKTEIAKTILSRREYLELNQEDLAEMTGITIKTIYLIESGRGNPSINTLQKIMSVLGLEITMQVKKIDA